MGDFLKDILPIWIAGGYDNVSEVANMAQATFDKTIPPQKQPKAIFFCLDKLQDHVIDVLSLNTAKIVAQQKVSEEIAIEKLYRSINGSIGIIIHVLRILM